MHDTTLAAQHTTRCLGHFGHDLGRNCFDIRVLQRGIRRLQAYCNRNGFLARPHLRLGLFARELVNTPVIDLTATDLAKQAKEASKRHGFSIEVL